MSIRNWPEGESPRDKLISSGVGALTDAELLAVLFGCGARGHKVDVLARALLSRFAGLRNLLAAGMDEVVAQAGVGAARYSQLQAVTELARRAALEGLQRGEVLTNPEQTRSFLRYHFAARQREVFCCLFLDSQHSLILCEDLFWGTLDGAAVYPREVVSRALQLQCAAIIFAHNHPSGVAEPSRADRRITERLQAALALIDIRVLDHIVVGRGELFSFAESGLL